MSNRTVVALSLLSLLTTASAAHATGYYLVVYSLQSGGGGANGFEGFSPNIVNGYTSDPLHLIGDTPSAALADFNGDGIPEVVTSSSKFPGCTVWNFNTGADLADFGPGNPSLTGGPLALTPPTITEGGSGGGTFTYAPGGTPTPANPFLDLNGDGIADSISYNSATLSLTLTNGATNQTTTVFAGIPSAPSSVSIVTWTPAPSAAPEPASLTLLGLAAPLLLKRRRKYANH